MDLSFLYEPATHADAWLEGLFHGAPLAVALGVALLLGLRHASDPDHLVAVTSLVAAENGDARVAARLGAWWGLGHALTLFAIGLPLITLRSEVPPWVSTGAEKAVGVVIVVLALRVGWKWLRRDFHVSAHDHGPDQTDIAHDAAVRHLRSGSGAHRHRHVRGPWQAFSIGALHGLAGTGAVVVLLIASLPSELDAVAALAVFAPMTIVSMTFCTAAFGWILTRPIVAPLYRNVVIPVLGGLGVMFGLWHIGIT